MTTNESIGRPPGAALTPCVKLSAHQPHGEGDWHRNWWCPGVPESVEYERTDRGRTVVDGVPQSPEQLLVELEAEPVVELTTQEELLTALDELLDNALHGDGCYIGPEDTVCFCVISTVRAVLPRCPETRTPPGYPEVPGTPRYWRCQRTAHPASPDRHTFGAV